MGLCWSTTLPDDDEDNTFKAGRELVRMNKARMAGPNNVQGVYNLGSSFNKEEVRLRELLSALRTGLVFSPTEFSVLPGITTTARVKFVIGSAELSPKVQETEEEREERSREELESENEGQDEANNNIDEEEKHMAKRKLEGSYNLKLPLTGESWTKGLTFELEIWPALGAFAGRKLMFQWTKDLLLVQGCRKGEISVRELPESFESERDFCKCCLLMVYQQNTANNLNFNEGTEQNDQKCESSEDSILPKLTTLAYKVAISNLDAVPDSVVMPAKVYHLFFGSHSPVSVSVKIWPQPHTTEFIASPIMHVKAGILFSEFVYLLREHFHIPPHYSLKLYHNHKQLQMDTTITAKNKEIDCFVVRRNITANATGGSYASLDEEEFVDSRSNLVVSLVGRGMQNVQVDLGMMMKGFDTLLRSRFNLREDSFLIIRSDDDFAPPYSADDNWKCTHPFSVPDSSFSAGLRRSFKRMSHMRSGNRLTQSQRGSISSSSVQDNTFSSLMTKVVALLSSNDRQFPSSSGKYALSKQALYDSMPMYRMSLDQCGIHPYSIVQVFEVTGPSIPITFRVVSDYTAAADSEGKTLSLQNSFVRTRLANIMDINPSWSVNTFLQYVDAVISPVSGVRRKRIYLKDEYIEDSGDLDLSEQTLGKLLDTWGPSWWPLEGEKRAQLSIKDIDPAEFLVVERY